MGFGAKTAFRQRLSEPGLACRVGVTGQVDVWPPGPAPPPPRACSGRGYVSTQQRLSDAAQERPLSMKELMFALPASKWQTLERREGANFTLRA